MIPSVTFGARFVDVAPGSDGAQCLLGHLAKPTNPVAAIKKLQNWRLWMDPNASPNDRRSRRQIKAGMLDIWQGLHTAIVVGERFSKMTIYHEGSWRFARDGDARARFARPIGQDNLTQWKNWLPVSHAAAGFRETMFKRGRGQGFSQLRTDDERLAIVDDLLIRDTSWLPEVLHQAEGWLLMSRSWARTKSPSLTLLFRQAGAIPSVRKNSTPDAKLAPHHGAGG